MIFVFIVSMFGLWTVFRTLNIFVRERFLARDRQIFLLLGIFAIQLGTIRLVANSFFGVWAVGLLPILISKSCFKLLIFIREKRFKQSFTQLIDEIIIEMRTGKSFRTSLSSANEKSNPFVQQKVRKIIELVRFKTNIRDLNDPYIESIVQEFRQIDDNSHNSLQRILSLRHRIRTESDYRRKSGQVVLQIRAQAAILIVLYFATALFVFANNKASSLGAEILVSFLLFFIGTAIVFLYGRSYKWKV